MVQGMEEKHQTLEEILQRMRSVLIAFSGGVDSTFLLRTARDVLGKHVTALTALSPTYPEQERQEAEAFAESIGVPLIQIESNELTIPNFSRNDPMRCYYCKSELFGLLRKTAEKREIAVICDGSNADDTGDYRPGFQAAREQGVRHPLMEAGLTKKEIRTLSRKLGLPTWQKASMACLSSRFPYGTKITEARLQQVAHCEELLRSMGFDSFRVRYHGEIARIEVPRDRFDEILAPDHYRQILETFKKAGFVYITLDLEGFRSGSMNEVFQKKEGGRESSSIITSD